MYCYPFPMVSITVDCVIIRRHGTPQVLLVKRKNEPYIGEHALPGGYVNAQYETIYEALVREIKEETKISLTGKVVEFVDFFDNPNRDARARTISFCYTCWSYGDNPIAGDDAESLSWVNLADIRNETINVAFDHREMIFKAYKLLNNN